MTFDLTRSREAQPAPAGRLTAEKSVIAGFAEDGTPIWSKSLLSRERDARAGWIEVPAITEPMDLGGSK